MNNLEKIMEKEALAIGDLVVIDAKKIFGLKVERPKSCFVGYVHTISAESVKVAPYKPFSGLSGGEYEFRHDEIRGIENKMKG